MPTTTTYSAWVATKKGLPSTALQLKTDLVLPTRMPEGHVLVEIQAAALNPYIYKMTAHLPDFADGRPHIAERDFAGIVLDPNGTPFTRGAHVFGFTHSATATLGALAQYLVIPSTMLALTPPGIIPVEAAGLAIVTLTARAALRELRLEAGQGQTVLINGGSGGVGLAAIQIAKAMGVRVVATASGRNKERLLGLGVDEFIDYTLAPLHEQLLTRAHTGAPKFHGLFDAVGLTSPALYLHCEAYLAPGARYISAGGFPASRKALAGMLRLVFEGKVRPVWLGGVARKFSMVTCPQDKESLEEVRALVADGKVKPIVDSVHSFDRAGVMAAYDRIMTNRAVGKVVVEVRTRDSEGAKM